VPARHPFEEAVRAGLGDWPPGTVFLAAVSGGADSTAMLAALAALRDEAGGERGRGGVILRCLHVEHGMRPPEESRGDARAVEALCARLGVPCRVAVIPPGRVAARAKAGGGPEAAARFYRRRAWTREARRIGAARVLAAHTRDDLLETTLMGVLRGAGPAGLAALPRERGLVLRPLLGLTRADVLAYLAARSLPFRTDATNADPRYLRNRVRLALIPCLDAGFPGWRRALGSLGETQALAAAFLAEAARESFPALNREKRPGKSSPEPVVLPGWTGAPALLREEALFQAADLLPPPPSRGVPRRAAVRRFAAGGGKAADLGPVRVELRGADLVVRPAPPARGSGAGPWGTGAVGKTLLIKEPGFYTLEPGIALEVGGDDPLPVAARSTTTGRRGIIEVTARGAAQAQSE